MLSVVDENFRHIRELARSLDALAGRATASERHARSELAGMFSVTIVATYEGIVRETLIDYSSRFHPKFQKYVASDLGRMNARISWDDLRKHARKFDLAERREPGAGKPLNTYERALKARSQVVERRFRRELKTSYGSLFTWRNEYAHERRTSATFKDVYDAHRVSQYVIRTFVKAFHDG